MERRQPGDMIDEYRIESVLGEGAYAIAYKAVNRHTDEQVVLKVPDENLFADPALFQRYRRESQIARTLDHRNVQRSLDAGAERTVPYLVLEYVDGMNLRQAIRAHPGTIPLDRVVDWATQLADALVYLHEHGIVHRDLKPENILISQDGVLKLADFGTALMDGVRRLTWRNLSESIGTPDYMSPEQVQGDRGDRRSDIYSWGVLVYELLTGRVPFGGDNWMAVMASHLQQHPRAIRDLRPDCPPALEAVVVHAMRRHAANRYQSADELRADLGRLDTLDPASFDSSPEAPIGGMAAIESEKRMWLMIGAVALGFIALCALVITVSILFRS